MDLEKIKEKIKEKNKRKGFIPCVRACVRDLARSKDKNDICYYKAKFAKIEDELINKNIIGLGFETIQNISTLIDKISTEIEEFHLFSKDELWDFKKGRISLYMDLINEESDNFRHSQYFENDKEVEKILKNMARRVRKYEHEFIAFLYDNIYCVNERFRYHRTFVTRETAAPLSDDSNEPKGEETK